MLISPAKPPAIPNMTYLLFHPQALGHHCLTMPEMGDPSNDQSIRLNIILPALPIGIVCSSSRAGIVSVQVAIDVKAGERVAKIVEACRLNSAMATAHDMDLVDVRLGCPTSAKPVFHHSKPYQVCSESYQIHRWL